LGRWGEWGPHRSCKEGMVGIVLVVEGVGWLTMLVYLWFSLLETLTSFTPYPNCPSPSPLLSLFPLFTLSVSIFYSPLCSQSTALPCLVTITSCAEALIYSLPGLKLLSTIPFNSLRASQAMSTLCLSSKGHGLYMSSPTEIQRISMVKDDM